MAQKSTEKFQVRCSNCQKLCKKISSRIILVEADRDLQKLAKDATHEKLLVWSQSAPPFLNTSENTVDPVVLGNISFHK